MLRRPGTRMNLELGARAKYAQIASFLSMKLLAKNNSISYTIVAIKGKTQAISSRSSSPSESNSMTTIILQVNLPSPSSSPTRISNQAITNTDLQPRLTSTTSRLHSHTVPEAMVLEEAAARIGVAIVKAKRCSLKSKSTAQVITVGTWESKSHPCAPLP